MKWIKPSEISGTIPAPPSKSVTIRATAMALLCQGESQLHGYSVCDDALAGYRVAQALGAEMRNDGNCLNISGGGPHRSTRLNCRESGLCLRMFTPIASILETKMTLSGTASILKRPMGMMEQPIGQLGGYCYTNNGFPPVHVQGPIKGGSVKVDGSLSSQFLTGLLIALPLCRVDSEVIIDNLKSKPYIRLTEWLLKKFGIAVHSEEDTHRFSIPGSQSYKSQSISVEGDWSGASFLLVAGAIKGKVSVTNLQIHSYQADKIVLEVLKSANAQVSTTEDSVTVEGSDLKAFQFDASECPDLFPPLAVLACSCLGRSVIHGVERLRHKESDRASALAKELTRIGAKIAVNTDTMTITGTQVLGGLFDSHGDHRIAMAGAIAGLNSTRGVAISGWHCVSKSYPNFFADLVSIGGDVR